MMPAQADYFSCDASRDTGYTRPCYHFYIARRRIIMPMLRFHATLPLVVATAVAFPSVSFIRFAPSHEIPISGTACSQCRRRSRSFSPIAVIS